MNSIISKSKIMTIEHSCLTANFQNNLEKLGKCQKFWVLVQ